eukprot:4477813-Pyramimonas_sp.AAC.1
MPSDQPPRHQHMRVAPRRARQLDAGGGQHRDPAARTRRRCRGRRGGAPDSMTASILGRLLLLARALAAQWCSCTASTRVVWPSA